MQISTNRGKSMAEHFKTFIFENCIKIVDIFKDVINENF